MALSAMTRAARVADKAGPTARVRGDLSRARDIVTGLTQTLDHKGSPELSAQLSELYDFIADRVVSADHRAATGRLDAVAHELGGATLALQELRDAWAVAAQRIEG